MPLHSDQTALCLGARRVADGRLRRVDAGTVTEMARSLLREAREAGDGETRRRHDATRLDRIEPVRPVEPVPRAA